MTGRAAAFWAGCRQETRRLITQPWDAFVAFGLPLIVLVVVAFMLAPGVVRHSPVAVVDQDNSVFSRAAIRNMQASPALDVAYSVSTLDEGIDLVRQGKVFSVAHFPSGFSANAFRSPQQVTVYFNGAFQTAGALTGLQQTTAIAAAAAPRLEVRARQMGLPASALQAPPVQVSIIGNPQLNFEFFLGGLLAPGVLHLLAACSAILAVARLVHGGSFQGFKARMNGHTTSGLIGHLTPHFLIFTLWTLAWIAWLCGIRGWGIAGSMPVLILGIMAMIAASVALSALLVALTGDPDTAFSATAIYSGAAIAFSNGTLPLDHGPRFARIWSDILPYTHYLRLQTDQMVVGAPVRSSGPELLILTLIALFAFVGAALLIKLRARRAPKDEGLSFDLPPQSTGGAFLSTFKNLPKTRPVASLLILAVVLYAFYYPAAYSGQVAVGLPVAVVTPTQTPLTRNLVNDLNNSHGLEVAAVVPSPAEASELMRRGVIDGVIILPDRFESDLIRGAPQGVGVWLNGGYLVRVSSVGRSVAAAVAHVAEKQLDGLPEIARAAKLAPSIKQESLFNTTEGYGDYAVPAVSLIILQQTLLLGAAVIAAIRRETGAAALKVSGRLGLWLALTAIGTLSCLFYFGFVFWFQDYPRGGDIWGVILLSPLYAGTIAALGLCIGSLFDRHERVLQVIVPISAPLFFLSGATWPHFMLPDPLVWLAYLSPSTAGVQSFVRMNAMGASLSDIAPHALILALLGVVFISTWLLRGPLRRSA